MSVEEKSLLFTALIMFCHPYGLPRRIYFDVRCYALKDNESIYQQKLFAFKTSIANAIAHMWFEQTTNHKN